MIILMDNCGVVSNQDIISAYYGAYGCSWGKLKLAYGAANHLGGAFITMGNCLYRFGRSSA